MHGGPREGAAASVKYAEFFHHNKEGEGQGTVGRKEGR